MKKLQRYNLYCRYELYKQEHLAYNVPVETPRILFISNNPRGIERLLNHSKGVDTSSTAGVLFANLQDVLDNPYGAIFVAKDSSDPEEKYSIVSPVR